MVRTRNYSGGFGARLCKLVEVDNILSLVDLSGMTDTEIIRLTINNHYHMLLLDNTNLSERIKFTFNSV